MSQSSLRYPDFICIGAQKAGTTWLNVVLSGHPRVWLPRIKEIHYFNELYCPGHRSWTVGHRNSCVASSLKEELSRDKALDSKRLAELAHLAAETISDEWYGRIFASALDNQIAGEMTPEYSLLPEAGIRHLAKLNRKVKIIFMIRDPVDRAWSHMRMLASVYNFGSTIDNLAPMTKNHDVLDRCDYSAILRRWLEFISPERLIVLNYDDIAKAPEDVLSRAYDFLGLEAYPLPGDVLREKVFEGPSGQLPEPIYKLLRDELRPCYESLHPLVEKAFQPWIAKHFTA
jgi:hypothetical protein